MFAKDRTGESTHSACMFQLVSQKYSVFPVRGAGVVDVVGSGVVVVVVGSGVVVVGSGVVVVVG